MLLDFFLPFGCYKAILWMSATETSSYFCEGPYQSHSYFGNNKTSSFASNPGATNICVKCACSIPKPIYVLDFTLTSFILIMLCMCIVVFIN